LRIGGRVSPFLGTSSVKDGSGQPIVTATGGALMVTALVSAHTAILGFDLLGGAQAAGLLGFAIERTNLPDGTRE
jgi:hypothetical protein